jgi:hypothetical protein
MTLPPYCHISGGGVAWSSRFHLYPYEKKINWTTPRKAYPPPDPQNASDWFSAVYPVYCGCSPEFPCGCDDHHQNDSFVDALVTEVFGLGRLWAEGPPKDGISGCNATVNGETALVVEGTLVRGSSKRDPTMERTDETEDNLTTALHFPPYVGDPIHIYVKNSSRVVQQRLKTIEVTLTCAKNKAARHTQSTFRWRQKALGPKRCPKPLSRLKIIEN